MVSKAGKYLLVFLLLSVCFSIYSIGLDKLFFFIEELKDEQTVRKGSGIYFPYFIAYYWIYVLLAMVFFEFFVRVTPWVQSNRLQVLSGLIFGFVIGLITGDGNLSVYRGKFEFFKTIILYALLGGTFVILKLIYRITNKPSVPG